jgi:MerR family transcriptional regulator, heat shock protein HspR
MARRGRKTRSKAGYTISAVAEIFNLHPQTLRLYEREGLLAPSRSQGNTRLYTQDDLDRLQTILSLTRDLGVNLAGVEIILNMRQRLAEMEKEMQQFMTLVQHELVARAEGFGPGSSTALVPTKRPQLIRVRQTSAASAPHARAQRETR